MGDYSIILVDLILISMNFVTDIGMAYSTWRKLVFHGSIRR